MKRFLSVDLKQNPPAARYAAVLAATLFYLSLFLLLFPSLGHEAALLALLPVVTVGWLFRRRAGLLAGVVLVVVNGLLMLGLGGQVADILPNAAGLMSLTLIVIGGIVGRARELLDQVAASSARLQSEAEDRIMAETALQKALVKAEGANLAKSDFVSFVSHELRSPIAAIMLSQDLLVKYAAGSLSPTQVELLDTIKRSANHLSALVSDLTDVTRIETGQLYLDMGSVSAAEAIADVARSFNPWFEQKQQHLQVDLPPDLPLIYGDWMRLIQILTNLLSNAQKYTPAGGRIQVSAAAVSYPPDNGVTGQPFVRITVADSGIGIRREDQAKVFQKFYRASEDALAGVRGTGLGLAITKELVELQKGYVQLDSEYGQGTIVSIYLPAAESQRLPLPPATASAD